MFQKVTRLRALLAATSIQVGEHNCQSLDAHLRFSKRVDGRIGAVLPISKSPPNANDAHLGPADELVGVHALHAPEQLLLVVEVLGALRHRGDPHKALGKLLGGPMRVSSMSMTASWFQSAGHGIIGYC